MKRVKNDFYPTNSRLTELLLKHLEVERDDEFYRKRNINSNNFINILEPCAGQRHISKVLANKGYNVTSTDITDEPDPEDENDVLDCTKERYWEFRAISISRTCYMYDWVITNPPYKEAKKIIPLAYKYAKKGIAMLLRLSYLEPTKNRADFLKNTPLTKLIIVNPRPRFRNDTNSTDSVTSAWFVWEKDLTNVKNTQIIYETNWN